MLSKRGLCLAAMAGVLVAVSGCGQKQVAAGPPCPTVDAASFAATGYTTKQKFEYGGASYGYALGNAACEDVSNGGFGFTKHAVCDFTSPAILSVKTEQGEALYATGLGKSVRVSVLKDGARCELAAR